MIYLHRRSSLIVHIYILQHRQHVFDSYMLALAIF